MNIFIINLKIKNDLRSRIRQQTDLLGLNVEFIDAVVGNDISDTELTERVYDYPNCQLTKGIIGCAFSHMSIYKKMIADNIELSLILEDDAIIGNDIKLALSEIENIDNKNKANIYLLSKPTSYIKNKKLQSNVFNIHPIYDASGAHGYVINNLAAKKLIDRMQPLKWECDMWWQFRVQGTASIYCVLPTVVFDGDSNKNSSSLEQERLIKTKKREEYKNKLKKNEPHYQLDRIKNNILKKILYKIESLP